MPVRKVVGDAVFGSSISHSGVLLVRATGVGSESAISQIVSLVQAAQASRPPMQEFVDKVSAAFVPIVLFIAATTLVVRTNADAQYPHMHLSCTSRRAHEDTTVIDCS